MRRIIVKEARQHMSAARKIAHPRHPDQLLLDAGETLTPAAIIQLHEVGVYDLWVEEKSLEFFADADTSLSTAQRRLVDGLRDSFRHISAAGGSTFRSLLKRNAIILQETLRSVVHAASAVPCLPAMTEDETLLAHACDVCVISILLGLQLEGYLVEQRRRLNTRQARDVLNLALGALFHDVGELMLPADARESRMPAAVPGEHAAGLWQAHTDEGYTITRIGGGLDPSAAVIVQHHHQHFDGSGFGPGTGSGPALQHAPDAATRVLSGKSIHVYARIVMAADVLCQVWFGGARIPQPLVKVLWSLQQMPMRKWFDPAVFDALLALLPPFAEGMLVTLSDGRPAVITRTEQAGISFGCFPEVQVIREIDVQGIAGTNAVEILALEQCEALDIAAVDGCEVRSFLYGMRKGRTRAA